MEFSEREFSVLAGGMAFLTAFAFGTLLMSLMCRLSHRWETLDKPDGSLKCHIRPTATLGGIPLFGAIWIGLGVLVPVGYNLSISTLGAGSEVSSWLPLVISSLIILSMGVRDDLCHIMPRTKILFQMMASMVLIGSGLIIGRFGFFGIFEVSLGIFAIPFTLFWLVGSCNAFNFIDGLDGLASGLGTVIALVLAGFGFINGAYGPAVVALAVTGGLLSLWLFNFKPAMIFLGDSGSQLVGLLLGALVIETTTIDGAFSLPGAGIILSIPVLDALLSILRRYSKSESPACGDHRHIHHCLRSYGLSVRQVSLTLSAVALGCGGMAWLCQTFRSYGVAAVATIFVGIELYLGVRLGCLEPQRLRQRLLGRYQCQTAAGGQTSSSTGRAELAIIWERMKPLFEQMQLDRAILILEGVNENGGQKYQTYNWVRSNALITEGIASTGLPSSRWTKRFSLGPDASQIATLRLESLENRLRPGESLLHNEQRIAWLLKQISENIRTTSRKGVGLAKASDPRQMAHPIYLTETAVERTKELIDVS